MKILVINAGSSSFKYQLIDMATKKPLCSGLVERIGEPMGKLIHKIAPDTGNERKVTLEEAFPNHVTGMNKVVALLTDAKDGVIKDLKEITAVGHRVVQGGEIIKSSCLVTPEVKANIKATIPLAPLHNPANLAGIEVIEQVLPHAPSVVVVDTEFHQTMAPEAYMYAIPYELYEKYSIRKYGAHGTSHRYVSRLGAKNLGKDLSSFNAITCHLGNGCSMSAIENGKCVDTSMGMTPLAGLMMGTRCGDIDPAIHCFLANNAKMTIQEIDTCFNKESGIKGIAGMNDMRDLHAACDQGNKKAQLAVAMFSRKIKQTLGSYYATLGRVDAVIFTAGIGENDDIVRALVCKNMENLGIEIDLDANAKRSGEARLISKPGSKVAVLVVPTNEELEIAEATQAILAKN